MPGTWAEVSKAMQFGLVDRRIAAPAILGGAYYMAKLRGQWSSKRPDVDRHRLAAASYNAGLGHLLKAQKLCGGAVLYDDIIRCLPDVTGKHSRETTTYVVRIWTWWELMELDR